MAAWANKFVDFMTISRLQLTTVPAFISNFCNTVPPKCCLMLSSVRWYKGSARYIKRREWNRKMGELKKEPPKKFDYKMFISKNYDKELYAFANRLSINPDNAHLKRSLVHRSFLINNENDFSDSHNGKLAVLGFNITAQFISEFLFFSYPNLPSSELRTIKDYLLSREVLVNIAKSLSIPELIQTSFDLESSEKLVENNIITNEDIISDALLALVGSIYVDEGSGQARSFVYDFITVLLYGKELQYMSTFQNPELSLAALLLQQNKEKPVVRILNSSTKFTNTPSYVVGVYSSETLLAKGVSPILQKARNEAIFAALIKLLNSNIPQLSGLPSDKEPKMEY